MHASAIPNDGNNFTGGIEIGNLTSIAFFEYLKQPILRWFGLGLPKLDYLGDYMARFRFHCRFAKLGSSWNVDTGVIPEKLGLNGKLEEPSQPYHTQVDWVHEEPNGGRLFLHDLG
ncbi:hypothetical protein IFM89_028314 [Coptis chinensis]|uniref:Uncharacterized protein n=1 Tax=Coptis chinensis TaxID=261450 RepID=A0A835M208_9MAGN|nr:hypothetical protein IFM89_028314 [Coptis chinensis]